MNKDFKPLKESEVLKNGVLKCVVGEKNEEQRV